MLTSEQSLVRFENGRAVPDRLTRKRHAHWLGHAGRMIDIYRSGVGVARRELHLSVRNLLAGESDCDPRRIAAFCKLLDDASEFQTDPRGESADLRLRIFSMAAAYHPLVETPDHIFEHDNAAVRARIASELGLTWDQIDSRLYADVPELQPLESFAGYPDAAALLSRYNVAQLQACLYRAQSMTVIAGSDLKTLVHYAKLCRLLIGIRRVDAGRYRLEISGPASELHETRRYGVALARFTAVLLSCRDWSMRAVIQTPWRTRAALEVTSADGYTSHVPTPREFDSSVEESFAAKWGESRDGWRMLREGMILHQGQTTFIPDFIFRHDDGTEVNLEIVGFWTPQYLQEKRRILRLFREHRILLAVARQSLHDSANPSEDVIVYKTALKVEPVLARLEARRATG